jgi:hypothetical protein
MSFAYFNAGSKRRERMRRRAIAQREMAKEEAAKKENEAAKAKDK